ncbi:GNAT family N-acetyltransferase [Kibdelosporangium phytohabitans]|uniref:GCN5 family acetyltransferase n=1 Tax=Kibdelosporangium phytohabitans TaxID=860235 RepID=A0A0N9I8V4_9PSEU|nr:GNAT family N-acetyltransferase [Kibdelosporangium phytohabitans]ALG12757.1 GCN5 family acetyltransferase [Kibdelosporangium phytohabitans]MBE1464432.1 GNAT superfamily N-acetyltransferase [Kibdelosporangium phytohabitans]
MTDTHTWRLRVELDDSPGVLARITTRLAARDCNVLALSILPVPSGVVDELVVKAAPDVPPAELVREIRAEGGRCLGITHADVRDLVDPPTAALRAAAMAFEDPCAAPEALRTLLAADSVTYESGEPGRTLDGGHRAILDLGDGTTVAARRGWAPFTDVELARAAVFTAMFASVAVDADPPSAIVLPDGAGVVLRRGDIADLEPVSQLHARCSARTLFARYHSGVRTLPRRLLHRLLTPPRGSTILAVCGREVVGIGQLIRTARPEEAEVSLLIEDSWQHKGIGTALLRRLAVAARAEGHRELVAWCLPGESGFERTAVRAGISLSVRTEQGMHRIGLRVGESAPQAIGTR